MVFRRFHSYFPALAILAGIALQYSGVDLWLEYQFYDVDTHSFVHRDDWLTEQLIHRDGRLLVTLVGLGITGFFISSLVWPRLKDQRRNALYLLLASLSGVAIVGWLKSVTHIHTPWELRLFGGEYPYILLFDHVTDAIPVGHAFPAGHASGGFALLSFYFLYRQYAHPYRYYYLVGALLTGMVFGLAQEARGAHMLSHDFFSLAICWSASLFWSRVLFGAGERLPIKQQQPA